MWEREVKGSKKKVTNKEARKSEETWEEKRIVKEGEVQDLQENYDRIK